MADTNQNIYFLVEEEPRLYYCNVGWYLTLKWNSYCSWALLSVFRKCSSTAKRHCDLIINLKPVLFTELHLLPGESRCDSHGTVVNRCIYRRRVDTV